MREQPADPQHPFYRHFTVTTTADDGPGSLRQAILEANAACVALDEPCLIDFAIADPPGAGGYYTIRPLTALPPLTAPDITVDGSTQTRFGGDTNPLGPEIEINGTLAPSGSGLEFRTDINRYLEARHLTVNGFPDNGISAHSVRDAAFTFRAEGNYIGVDPTGSKAVPNGLRGIGIAGFYGYAQIVSNLISGNIRSGIFIINASASITGNRIVENGASGIYLGPGTFIVSLADNVIARNHQFGIATQGNFVEIGANSIFGNGGPGIDFDLDGSKPVIRLLSARYDAATGTTIITGEGPPAIRDRSTYTYRFFRDDGETFLGAMVITSGRAFRFSFDGDLRGKFITATATSLRLNDELQARFTSEFSDAIEVQ